MLDELERWAKIQPEKVAIAMSEGDRHRTYGELDDRATQLAKWLGSLGLAEGAVVALVLDNDVHVIELWWAAKRAGCYYLPIAGHLKPAEMAFILRDADVQVVVVGQGYVAAAAEACHGLGPADLPHRFVVGDAALGFSNFEDAVTHTSPDAALSIRRTGRELIYSSGTTGSPKGVRRALTPRGETALPPLEIKIREIFQMSSSMVYLSCAPLYHATGRFLNRAIEAGGACIIMPKFDAMGALKAIERHKVTHTQWVPTMFQRLLALPPDIRGRFDISSLKLALHSAAPCPVSIKRQMIDWWGPIVDEYYGGTENVGVTFINAADWLDHPGSVGRAVVGAIHILSDDGEERELPPGEIGQIYFSGGVGFVYHNDAAKTRGAFSRQGWGTYGDLGSVDPDGYLYISDRRTDLIISGGVNIYPKEIENVLETHPKVLEAAVVAKTDAEFGQSVLAVVRLIPGVGGDPALKAELTAHVRSQLSSVKAPKFVEFVEEFPRSENGKLLKRILRETYGG
jgi:long-chain acyl-CoA synthetase